MLKPLFALLVLAAPAAMSSAQTDRTPDRTPARTPGWTLANGAEGCLVHASSPHGTVLSISGTPGEDAIMFVIQNHQFASLDDGGQYGIEVEFDDLGEWEIPGVAQNHLDADGPGLIFAVKPGQSEGANFITEFAGADGMRIGRDGTALDSVPLGGGRGAMASLATCLSQKWPGGSGAQGQGGPLIELENGETPVAL